MRQNITPLIYEVINLEETRKFLYNFNKPVILMNKRGSTRYYGMLILDYMFKQLIKEFPQITKIIVHVADDHVALFTAIKLNYQHIVYTGNSKEARAILLQGLIEKKE